MITKLLIASTCVVALTAGPVFSQATTATEEPKITYEDLAEGDLYFKETFTDWRLRCQKTAAADDYCELHQLLRRESGGAVAQISFYNLTNTDTPAILGANVTVPLETALFEGLKFKIDEKQPKVYPFSHCDAVGCHARLGFTAVELKWLQDGSIAKMVSVPFRGDREPVVVGISLSGFTAGYKAVVDNNLPN